MFLRLQPRCTPENRPPAGGVCRAGLEDHRRFLAAAILLASVTGLAGTARADDEGSMNPTAEPARRVSLWDRPVAGTDITYAELTIEGKSPDELEPVLLPLPAPALAAGVGLGIAWVIRRRFGRR